MTPWQRHLWHLAHPDARPQPEDEPIVIQDECPATDGMTLEELERSAEKRRENPGRPKGKKGVPIVAPDDRRCHAVVCYSGGVKARCRRPARANGYCWGHEKWAGRPGSAI